MEPTLADRLDPDPSLALRITTWMHAPYENWSYVANRGKGSGLDTGLANVI